MTEEVFHLPLTKQEIETLMAELPQGKTKALIQSYIDVWVRRQIW